ncbi:hypothetical protein ACPUER_12070 [Burkholderia sp. DN3021]|uniref:hypothetical protein n=1 Tax=Burkholderia sp. DN3021 TaxID=3410137 RepID=UPI003C7E736F
MDAVTKYNVYEAEKLVASYDAQAPATSLAKNMSRKGRSLDVVEEVFGHVSSRTVRHCIDGKIHKCS